MGQRSPRPWDMSLDGGRRSGSAGAAPGGEAGKGERGGFDLHSDSYNFSDFHRN